MNSHRRILAFLLLIASAVPVEAGSDLCSSPPILDVFEEAGILERPEPGRLQIEVAINRHSQDCGAPDGYGTNLILDLYLKSAGETCRLERISVHSEVFLPVEFRGTRPAARTEDFFPETPVDLSRSDLGELKVASESGSRALIFYPLSFWYFEGLEPGDELIVDLHPADNTDPCCYGATAAQIEWTAREMSRRSKTR